MVPFKKNDENHSRIHQHWKTHTENTMNIVENQVSGILLAPDDAPAFADQLENMIRDSDFRKQLGETALLRSQRFRWKTILDEMSAHYDHWIDKNGPTCRLS